MNESNRRRILAGICAALLSVTLLLNVLGRLSPGTKPPSHGAIALQGFFALLHVGLTAGAAIGITQLVRRKSDRLGLFGAAFAILGSVVAARIGVVIQLSLLGDAATGPGRPEIASMLGSAPVVWASIVPIGLMYPIGLIALGAALFVARPVSRWTAVLLLIGGLFFPLGRALQNVPALYVSDVALAIAYGYLSKDILTRRELWEDSLVTAPRAERGSVFSPQSAGNISQ